MTFKVGRPTEMDINILRCFTYLFTYCSRANFDNSNKQITYFILDSFQNIWNVTKKSHFSKVLFLTQIFYFLCESRQYSPTPNIGRKHLGSGLSPQICLYFQGFWGSKLLNSCLVVSPRNLCLQGIQ